MVSKNDKSNFFARLSSNPKLSACGVKTEALGDRSVKISRGQRALGTWREAMGCYHWYPAGQNYPQTMVPTVEDCVRHLNRSFGAH